MVRRFYRLPPLTTLATFEAAARHQSVKHAAAELNVTPGAVSHQIKALEGEVGTQLFRRVHRGIELTGAGHELYAVLSRGFQETASVLDRLRAENPGAEIQVGASTAVAALWLMPRITDFWSQHPDIRISLYISDDVNELLASRSDLMIRYGSGDWPDCKAEHVFDDELMPVCSPDFARANPVADVDALAELPLIQMHSVDAGWTTWREWFAMVGRPGAAIKGPSFNNYTIALQAAENGTGVALGWRRLIAPRLEADALVPLTDISVEAPGAFYLCLRRERSSKPDLDLLLDWLRVGPQIAA
ncbi:MAG: transcriptional regulator GcvA [Rhizobiaceae bacterium]